MRETDGIAAAVHLVVWRTNHQRCGAGGAGGAKGSNSDAKGGNSDAKGQGGNSGYSVATWRCCGCEAAGGCDGVEASSRRLRGGGPWCRAAPPSPALLSLSRGWQAKRR